MLSPPVVLMEAAAVARVPAVREALWQPKIDGWRCAAFVGAEGVRLQGRSRKLITERFPEIVRPLLELPAGTVLDGEVVAWRAREDGVEALDFSALNRTVVHRRQLGVSVQYLAFDVLARPGKRGGQEDVRGLPLSQRWPLLLDLLGGAPPRIGPALSTTDRAEGEAWAGALVDRGFEGLVVKRASSVYDFSRGGWWKIRAADTVDGEVVGVAEAASTAPRLRVLLEDGRELVTEPLSVGQARELAEVVVNRGAGSGPLRVELRSGAGRHGTTRFVRARPVE